MNKAAAYLDEVKTALSLSSDYALAKHLGFPKQYISGWRSGKRVPDAYACTLMAIALKTDPARVIAEIHADSDKDQKRVEFWRSFLSRASRVAGVLCTLALICSAGFGSEAAPLGGGYKRRLRTA